MILLFVENNERQKTRNKKQKKTDKQIRIFPPRFTFDVYTVQLVLF